MNEIRISMDSICVTEVLEQIDSMTRIEPRQRNILRLLSEEMFSMMENVLKNREASFEIRRDGSTFELCLSADVIVNKKAREAYMSLSTDGKNMAHRGIVGKMMAILEAWGDAVPLTGFDYVSELPEKYEMMWSMSDYINAATEAEKLADWDGMEKSIIANFADDVRIGVRSSRLEMIVAKRF